MSLYKAGYLAAMKDVQTRIEKRFEVLDGALEGCDGDELMQIDACNRELMGFKNWLAKQVEKEGHESNSHCPTGTAEEKDQRGEESY